MSEQYPGGWMTKSPPTPSGPYQDGAAPGVWTLDQVAYWQKQGLWPIAGNAAPIGLFGGGSASGNTIDQVVFASTSNATDFGDLTVARQSPAACASATRGVWAGSGAAYSNVIDYVEFATKGNASDFGDLPSPTSCWCRRIWYVSPNKTK